MSAKKPPISFHRQIFIDNQFHIAAGVNDLIGVAAWLLNGAEINGTNDQNLTAAQVAIENGYHEILSHLSINPNFDVNALQNINGKHLFEIACMKDDFKALQILSDDIKDAVQVTFPFDNDLLHYCAMHNSQRICMQLIRSPYCFNVNVKNIYSETPLHIAVRSYNLEIIPILLQRLDFNFVIFDNNGVSAIQQAITQGYLDALKLMIGHPNIRYFKTLSTPIYASLNLMEYTCMQDQCLVAKLLFDTNCPMDGNQMNRTVFHLCSKYNSVNVCKMFIRPDYNFIDINALEGTTRKTALHEACATSNTEIVLILLQRADIELNLVDRNGYTAIGYACRHNQNLMIVKALINKNIDINYRNPLAIACQKASYTIVEELLTHPNINVDYTNKYILECSVKMPALFQWHNECRGSAQ